MRCFCLIFLFLCVSELSAAQDSIPEMNFDQSLDLFFGQKFFRNGVLNNAVSNAHEPKFGRPLSYVGIQFTGVIYAYGGSLFRPERSYPCSVSFHHIIPQQIDFNDSVSGRVSGFNISVPLEGFDFFRRKKKVDLILGSGFNMGRVRLFGDSRLEQVNAYFAPFISIAPRINIGKISVQFRAEYELDITRSRWRKVWFSSSPKVDLGSMKSTGLNTSFSVGWNF